jgi:hypothetical protein
VPDMAGHRQPHASGFASTADTMSTSGMPSPTLNGPRPHRSVAYENGQFTVGQDDPTSPSITQAAVHMLIADGRQLTGPPHGRGLDEQRWWGVSTVMEGPVLHVCAPMGAMMAGRAE